MLMCRLLGPANRAMKTEPVRDLGLLLLRGMMGVVFVFHGSQKLFGAFDGPGLKGFAGYLESMAVPMPQASAALAGGAEFFGGLLLAVGLLTRLASLPVIFTMVMAIVMAHTGKGFSAQNGGLEYPLTLAVVTGAVTLLGPGRLSLDFLLGRGVCRSDPSA